jgi:hypothetical protein
MDIVVQHAELLPGARGEGIWKISLNVIRDGETERQATIMPADAIEWRIAQFNVDAQSALDMVILESYITDVTHQDLELIDTRSGARQRKLKAMTDVLAGGSVSWPTGKPEWMVGSGNEPTKIVDSGNGSARDTILAESPVSDDVIAVKREALDRARARTRAGAQSTTDGPAAPPPGAQGDRPRLRRPDITELRSRLQLDRKVDAESSGPADVRRERET